jgi:hypothetical protein
MNAANTKPFVPLEDFWSDYLSGMVSVRPPARTPNAISQYLDLLFGDLTVHAPQQVQALPIQVDCQECRNLKGQRRDSVCRTHLGAIRGSLQAVLGVPLAADFSPGEDGRCSISMWLARGNDGQPLIATAKRAPYIRLGGSDSGRWWVSDLRSTAVTEINEPTARLLLGADEARSVEDLALEQDIDLQIAAPILDQCFQLGWVECDFEPREPPKG